MQPPVRQFTEPAQAAQCVRAGGVLAYPTEAVFGLGCHWQDEQALRRILAMKGRPQAQGVILLVADRHMLAEVADLSGPFVPQWQAQPGITWLYPPARAVPDWVRGRHARVAVRIPNWAPARELAAQTGPLVSTSANRSGNPPARDVQTVLQIFARELDGILALPCGQAAGPSPIHDAITGERLR